MLRGLLAFSGMLMFANIFLPGLLLYTERSSARDQGWATAFRRLRKYLWPILAMDLAIFVMIWALSTRPVPTCEPGYTLAGGGLFGGAEHCVEGRPVLWKAP